MWEYQAKITRIIDADTVDALLILEPQQLVKMGDGAMWWDFGFYFYAPVADAQRLPRTIQRFRLAGIDAPEVRGEERPEGLLASAWLKDFINKEESMFGPIKIASEKKGKYGRYIGTLFTSRGLNINEELIRVGHATKYPL